MVLILLAVPAVERIVYSTCSINEIENEDVIKSVLPTAESYGFQLVTPFPQWQRRGLPTFEGCKFCSCTVRAGPQDYMFVLSAFHIGFWWLILMLLVCFVAAEHLLRTDPAVDGEGFFIALFAKKGASFSTRSNKDDACSTSHNSTRTKNHHRKQRSLPLSHTNIFKLWLHHHLNRRGSIDKADFS